MLLLIEIWQKKKDSVKQNNLFLVKMKLKIFPRIQPNKINWNYFPLMQIIIKQSFYPRVMAKNFEKRQHF